MSVLVGYVPTPIGEAAVRSAIEECQLRGTNLLIVNSKRKGALVDASVATDTDLALVLAAAKDAGVSATLLRPTFEDDLAESIIALAEEHNAALIVIGLRPRSPVGKFIMGSQAQRILLQADRPVLAVKAAASH